MKHLLYKDQKYRQLFFRVELLRILYKCLFFNLSLKSVYRLKAYIYLMNFSKLSSLTRIKNRCVYTGRGQAIYRSFRVSRIFLKKLISEGNILGVTKSSF